LRFAVRKISVVGRGIKKQNMHLKKIRLWLDFPVAVF